jgi:hypothetical protein
MKIYPLGNFIARYAMGFSTASTDYFFLKTSYILTQSDENGKLQLAQSWDLVSNQSAVYTGAMWEKFFNNFSSCILQYNIRRIFPFFCKNIKRKFSRVK